MTANKRSEDAFFTLLRWLESPELTPTYLARFSLINWQKRKVLKGITICTIMVKSVAANENQSIYSNNIDMSKSNNIGNMNRGLLSSMTKEQLNMILNTTASTKEVGPVVKKTVSTKAGPVNNPKSLTQLGAEKLEQSIKRPASRSVRDKIKYFESKASNSPSIISINGQPVSFQDMREEELANARVSKYKRDSLFQNLFEQRLREMPGKRENVPITIQADVEYTLRNRTELEEQTYGPFSMEVPELSKPDTYKFLMYTLLTHNFTILSTQTIANIGAKISAHNEQFFKNHKVGALKLNTIFLDKQFQIKQRGDNTCMVDFVWHNCKGKKGFKTHTYKS